jgi:hypothetical protein
VAELGLMWRHTWQQDSDEERLARVAHAPKYDGCKARASHAPVSAWPEKNAWRGWFTRKPVAARSACNSRASKRVGRD